MGYGEYLAELLRPLGVYDLRPGAINRGELESYGGALDTAAAELEETAREMLLATAEGFGLERVEELLPYRPASGTLEQRRAALEALLRIGGDSFTLAAVNDTLKGCGINAVAAETGDPGRVEVRFPGVEGVPERFDELRAIIGEIIPCHLEIDYLFWYNTWDTVGKRYARWGKAVDAGLSWHGLATQKE